MIPEKSPLQTILTTQFKEGMLNYIHQNPHEFSELRSLALSQQQPYVWRAAWLISNIIQENDHRLLNHISNIIDILPVKKEGHNRSRKYR